MAGQNTSGSGGASGKGVRAGRAFVELHLDSSLLHRGLIATERRLKAFSGALLKIGGVTAGLGVSVLAPIAAIFTETLDHFDAIAKASERVGTSTEIFSSLAYAAKQSGASAEDLEIGLTKVVATLADAAAGGKEASDAFKSIGLNAEDLIGLPLDEQLQLIADALNDVDGAEARLAATRKLFGRGGTSLTPLLSGGGSGIRELQGRSGLLGATVKSQDAKDAVILGDALSDVWTGVKNAIRAVGLAFLPLKDNILAVTDAVIVGAKTLREWIGENHVLVAGVAAVAGVLAITGGVLVGFGITLGFVVTAVSGFAGALAGLGYVIVGMAPALAVLAELLLIGGAFLKLWSMGSDGEKAIAQIRDGFWQLLDTARTVGTGIGDALAVGDFRLAWNIALTGVSLEFAKAVSFWIDRWNFFKSFFVDGWHDALKLLRLAWIDLDEWFHDMFLTLAQGLNMTIGDGISKMLGRVIDVINRIPARLRGILGLADIAAELEKLKGAFGTGTFTEELENEKKKNAKLAADRKALVEKIAAAQQEARKAARDADKAKADDEVERLKEELKQLEEKAARNRAIAAGLKAFLGVGFPSSLPGQARNAAAVAESVRGSFGGANARQIFAFGDKGIQREQLDEQKGIREEAKGIRAAIENLDGVAFA